MGTSPCFSAIFTKKNNLYDFLFASLGDRTSLLFKERICSQGFLQGMTPIEKGDRNQIGRNQVAVPLKFAHLQ